MGDLVALEAEQAGTGRPGTETGSAGAGSAGAGGAVHAGPGDALGGALLTGFTRGLWPGSHGR